MFFLSTAQLEIYATTCKQESLVESLIYLIHKYKILSLAKPVNKKPKNRRKHSLKIVLYYFC